MKRILYVGVLAMALAALSDTAALAIGPPGVGASDRRLGRITGFWMQPTTGRLYDYSPYFAANYPQIPGSQEVLAREQLQQQQAAYPQYQGPQGGRGGFFGLRRAGSAPYSYAQPPVWAPAK
jgi:hypothetical protein